jgi:hypothetical protein
MKRSFSLLCGLALCAALPLLSCSEQACPQPQHPPHVDKARGEPCNTTADCQAGLDCLHAYDARIAASKACTTVCAPDGACPEGQVCLQPKGKSIDGGSWPSVCVNTCATDEDCRGSAAGVCYEDTELAEGLFCRPIECLDPAQCPDGYVCEWSANACCTAGSYCAALGLQPGYCRPASEFDGGVI